MENNDVKVLIESFKEYRDLLGPVQKNLGSFIDTYDSMKDNIDKLNNAFGADIKEKLEGIYKSLSSQAEKASDLSTRIDHFMRISDKYTQEVGNVLKIFNKVEERLSAVNKLEADAEAQLGRLDAILEEKSKSYNVRDLQRTLEQYNNNVQRVSEFINKDVSESLIQSGRKLESIKDGMEDVVKRQRNDNISIDKLLETYQSSSELLKRIAEKGDVNEAYIFEILDKWAENRRVKIKK